MWVIKWSDLLERRPLLFASLGQAVIVVTVGLEDVGCAQLVERPEGHSWGIPEAHCSILVPKKHKKQDVTATFSLHCRNILKSTELDWAYPQFEVTWLNV